jgi:hypothetical protein
MVRPGLSRVLEEMELPEDPRLLSMPYNELCVEVPDGFDGWVFHNESGRHPLQYIYVAYEPDTLEGTYMRYLLVGRPNKNSRNRLDDALYFFRCRIYDDRSLPDSFDIVMEDMRREHEGSCYDQDGGVNMNMSRKVFRYILNILLYISSTNADIEWRDTYPKGVENKLAHLKDEKRIRQLKKRNADKRYRKGVVGQSVIYVPYNHRHGSHTGGSNSGWKLEKRVFVSAHWQRYYYGHGANRVPRPKFVNAYWKGPDQADLVHTKHIVR